MTAKRSVTRVEGRDSIYSIIIFYLIPELIDILNLDFIQFLLIANIFCLYLYRYITREQRFYKSSTTHR